MGTIGYKQVCISNSLIYHFPPLNYLRESRLLTWGSKDGNTDSLLFLLWHFGLINNIFFCIEISSWSNEYAPGWHNTEGFLKSILGLITTCVAGENLEILQKYLLQSINKSRHLWCQFIFVLFLIIKVTVVRQYRCGFNFVKELKGKRQRMF